MAAAASRTTLALVALLAAAVAPQVQGQCAGNCGGFVPVPGCWCDALCTALNDCCPDAVPICLSGSPPPPPPPSSSPPPPPITASCVGFCGGGTPFGCFCDPICTQLNDCCPDAVPVCLSCVQPPPGNLPPVLTCPILSTAAPPQLTPSPTAPVTAVGGVVEPICGIPTQPVSVRVASTITTPCCTNPAGCPTTLTFNVNGQIITKTIALLGAPPISESNAVTLNAGFAVTTPQNFQSELRLYQFTTTAFNCRFGPTCPLGEAPANLLFPLNAGICPLDPFGIPEVCVSRCFNFEVVQCLTPCNGCETTLTPAIGTVFPNPPVISPTGFPPGPAPSSPPPPPPTTGQCPGFCGGFAPPFSCFCDDLCTSFNDCCIDAVGLCF